MMQYLKGSDTLREMYPKVNENFENIDDQLKTHEQNFEDIEENIQQIETNLQDISDSFNAHKDEYAAYKNSNNLEIAKIKKEIADYKAAMALLNPNHEAKQAVEGYGIVNLPPNCANGQISGIRMKARTYTNLLGDKGDFETSAGWALSNATISNAQKLYGSNSLLLSATNSTVSGAIDIDVDEDKYYLVYGHCYINEYTSGLVRISIYDKGTYNNGSSVSADTTKINQWQKIGRKFTGRNGVRVQPNIVNATAKVYFDGLMLTEITEDEYNNLTVDELLERYPYVNGTKSTIGAMRLKSVGKNLFDKNRALKGYFLNFTNGIQEPYSSPSFCSDFIRVDSNEQYYVTGFLGKGYTFIAFYDSNKNFTRRTLASPRYNILISDIQDHEKYIRITVYNNVNNPATWQDIDDVLNNLQVERGNVATPYEPYKESNAYIIAKDEEGNILELGSLPNGTKDEVRDIIRITNGKAELIRKVGNKKDVPNGTVINYADMADDGVFEAWGANGEHIVGVKGDTLDFDAVELNYQLAQEQVIPVQVSGTLVGFPSGTVYWEQIVPDAGVYTDKMEVLHKDLPIKSIEKIGKVDYTTGLEYELDPTQAVISSDGLSFTHPALANGDIVFFIYEYSKESTIPEMTVEYYDSRFVVKDSVTGKFYHWNLVVANGQWDIQLTEV